MTKDPSIELPALLTGRSEAHLVLLGESKVRVHSEMLPSFLRLQAKAKDAGFDMQIVSGFRGFADQLRIWNLKAIGQRPVLDARSQPIDVFSISSVDLVHAIMRWSALPAASRHHWGTDVDVIDAKAMPQGYRVQLTPEEVESGGIFAPLHDWLDENMGEEGFYRPYDKDRGGVSPERWHLSYYPLAAGYTKSLTPSHVVESWKGQEVKLREAVEKNIDDIFKKFVKNVAPSPPIN